MKPSVVLLVDVIVEEVRRAIVIDGKNWIYDPDGQYFDFNKFVLKNVTEKEDEEEWWKIYGPGIEVSGKSPDGCYNALVDMHKLIGEVIGKV